MLMKRSTNGNSANNNSTNTIKKNSITIRLKRPHVIYCNKLTVYINLTNIHYNVFQRVSTGFLAKLPCAFFISLYFF